MKKLIIALGMIISLGVSLPVLAESAADTTSTETVILYVDINNDSAEKMADLLNGIGLKKAEAIVAFRESNGPFAHPEDLLAVPGIGPATLQKNRNAIIIGDAKG